MFCGTPQPRAAKEGDCAMEAVAFFKSPPSSGCRLDSWGEAKRSFKNQLLRIAKSCGIFRQSMHESGLSSNRQLFVHVVKEEETLTSISKKYGVSMNAIASANFDIVDLDLVMEGQHLYIPIRVQKNMMVESKQIYRDTLDTCKSFLHAHLKLESQKFISTVASYSPPTMQIYRYTLDKYRSFLNAHLISESQKFISTVTFYSPPTTGQWTGYYLFFFPTLAFCIIYMLKAFQARDHKLLKQQRVEKSNVSQARSSPWRKILDDEALTDPCETSSTEELSNPSEEDQKLPFEEMCSAYTKLEPAYMKFLADCGMSKWGYWHGGARD